MSEALVQLLDGVVDYAGLFPPASLPMDEAVRNYAAYRCGERRAMLARFVLPAARLSEFATALASTARGKSDSGPWPLSVLATASDASAVKAFDAVHGARARVDTIESRAADDEAIAALAAAFPIRAVYVELDVRQDPEPLVAALRKHRLRAKIRTGGVTPDAMPSPAEVLRFLVACAKHSVPFKATAGLHHPLRGEYPLTYDDDAPVGTMYGHLNLLLAALLLRGGNAPDAVAPLLEEREAGAIRVENDRLEWRGLSLSASEIAEMRGTFVGAFGSCSFEEPVCELAELSLLPEKP